MSACRQAKMAESGGDLFDRIVNAYLHTIAPKESRYLKYYRIQRSLAEAIEKAAMAELPGGKRFSHQRQIPRAVLQQVKHALLSQKNELAACRSFDELLRLVDHATHLIFGVGPLVVYDTAHRIGAYLNLSPQFVYLHAGTRTGAKALGLDHKVIKLPKGVFPKAFQQLQAQQIEDCLCIYKRALKQAARP